MSVPNVTDNGEAVETDNAPTQAISYIPYGEVFVEQQAGGWSSPYLFNAKELDSETGLYYYGARYLDPSDAMWLSVDPLWEKYVGMTPYQYCAGNPVVMVDPNGRENIVVCGSQYDESEGNKLMFVNQGIRAIKEFAANEKNESRTMVLFKAQYTDNQIKSIRKSVEKYNGTLKVVDSANDLIDYINNKDGNRESDKISDMEIYSHGLNQSIEFGYKTKMEDTYRLDMDNATKISSNAFNGTSSSITSYACRTALGSDSYYWGAFTYRNKSLAQKISNSTGAVVYGFAVRTNYEFTLGSWSERRFNYPNPAPIMQKIDGAILTPEGAAHPVQGGATPMGIYSGMIRLTPQK